MRLADFIEGNRSVILADWDGFAVSLGAVTAGMSPKELRDHAEQVLMAIATEMRTAQSASTQADKGKGKRDAPLRRLTAASIHGTGRHADGFSLLQLTAEFRALRASVLRLWLPTVDHSDRRSIDDLIRFNESLDRAIAESVTMFTEKADEARDVFLAMLSHDLRSPLQAIGITADYFARNERDPVRTATSVSRIKRGVVAMTTMVNDLLEFSRLQLGGGRLPLIRRRIDLSMLGRRLIEDAEAAHPACSLRLVAPAPVQGDFDEDRLLQMFSNLLNNACQYGAQGSVITLTIRQVERTAHADIHNVGTTIPANRLNAIFNLMHQLEVDEHVVNRPRTSIGLGLFIARRIAEAHGGTLTVRSSESSGTTFSVQMPLGAEDETSVP